MVPAEKKKTAPPKKVLTRQDIFLIYLAVHVYIYRSLWIMCSPLIKGIASEIWIVEIEFVIYVWILFLTCLTELTLHRRNCEKLPGSSFAAWPLRRRSKNQKPRWMACWGLQLPKQGPTSANARGLQLWQGGGPFSNIDETEHVQSCPIDPNCLVYIKKLLIYTVKQQMFAKIGSKKA